MLQPSAARVQGEVLNIALMLEVLWKDAGTRPPEQEQGSVHRCGKGCKLRMQVQVVACTRQCIASSKLSCKAIIHPE